jgi:YD repeat-containing protein
MHYGLVAPLAAYSSLAFLSAGLLLGSYSQGTNEVYVYVVQEDGQDVQYEVDTAGNVISRTVLGSSQPR